MASLFVGMPNLGEFRQNKIIQRRDDMNRTNILTMAVLNSLASIASPLLVVSPIFCGVAEGRIFKDLTGKGAFYRAGQ